jgi:lipopolysaccharide/colanic/teichoic acid biosynthesis glycosyltransferase
MSTDNDDKSYENFRKVQEEIMKNATETIRVKVPQKEYYQKKSFTEKILRLSVVILAVIITSPILVLNAIMNKIESVFFRIF